MAPPPATAVADAMNPPARPRDSQANIDIMAVTKGFHWPWLIALVFALTGVGVAALTLAWQTYEGLGVAGQCIDEPQEGHDRPWNITAALVAAAPALRDEHPLPEHPLPHVEGVTHGLEVGATPKIECDGLLDALHGGWLGHRSGGRRDGRLARGTGGLLGGLADRSGDLHGCLLGNDRGHLLAGRGRSENPRRHRGPGGRAGRRVRRQRGFGTRRQGRVGCRHRRPFEQTLGVTTRARDDECRG